MGRLGHHENGLVDQPKPFPFHRRGDHHGRLAEADFMCQQSGPIMDDAVNGVPLVWPQLRLPSWVHAGELQMGPVEHPGTHGVVGVVVESDQPFLAGLVLPYPF